MDYTTFLQALCGIQENSLKDKIETNNPENDESEYLNIRKHSSNYDTEKFQNHMKNYKK